MSDRTCSERDFFDPLLEVTLPRYETGLPGCPQEKMIAKCPKCEAKIFGKDFLLQ
jgi:hypothetical protein